MQCMWGKDREFELNFGKNRGSLHFECYCMLHTEKSNLVEEIFREGT